MRASTFLLTAALGVAASFAAPVSSRAATVTLGLISRQIAPNSPAGEWELWAWTSIGDNDGIASYSIEMAGEGIHGDHTSPLILVDHGASSGVWGGFWVFRNSVPDATLGNVLFAAQRTIGIGDGILYGVGIPELAGPLTPPSFPSIDLNFTIDPEWWTNPTFSSSPSAPPYSVPGSSPFVVPAGAVQLGEGTTTQFNSLSVSSTSRVAVFELGVSKIDRVDVDALEPIMLVDYVPAVPEPASHTVVVISTLMLFYGPRMRKHIF